MAGWIRTDFHLHTEISVDAPTTGAEMVSAAVALGLSEIALTDHCDHNVSDEGAGRFPPREAYEKTEALRREWGDRIIIRHGVELAEPQLYEEKNAPIYELPLDMVIGSVHYVENWGVHADLFDVLPAEEAIHRYLGAVLETATRGRIDVLGHLDYFGRYTAQRKLPDYNPVDYRGQIRAILDAIIAREIALEVNSSGLRAGLGRPFPHPAVLGWYRDQGGRRISLGSDAHRGEHVAAGLDESAKLAYELGFREYFVYRNRTAHAIPLTPPRS